METALLEVHCKNQRKAWPSSPEECLSAIPESQPLLVKAGSGRLRPPPCSSPAIRVHLDSRSNCSSPEQSIRLRRRRRHHQSRELCSCSRRLPGEQTSRGQRLRRRTYQPSGWETDSAHNRKQWSQDGKSMPVARMTSEGLEPSSRNPTVNHSSILQLSHDQRGPVTCPHSPIPLTVPASWHWHSVKTKESVCEPGGFTRTVPCPRDITRLQYNSVVGLPCGPKQHPACTSGF